MRRGRTGRGRRRDRAIGPTAFGRPVANSRPRRARLPRARLARGASRRGRSRAARERLPASPCAGPRTRARGHRGAGSEAVTRRPGALIRCRRARSGRRASVLAGQLEPSRGGSIRPGVPSSSSRVVGRALDRQPVEAVGDRRDGDSSHAQRGPAPRPAQQGSVLRLGAARVALQQVAASPRNRGSAQPAPPARAGRAPAARRRRRSRRALVGGCPAGVERVQRPPLDARAARRRPSRAIARIAASASAWSARGRRAAARGRARRTASAAHATSDRRANGRSL